MSGDMGDVCKEHESVEADRKQLRGTVLVARFDGRAFHTLTRGCERPFDTRVQAAMLAAARAIVEDMRPSCAYTQSDEITCVWPGAVPFDGRFQKIASVGAALASVSFTQSFGEVGVFDGRAWQVPTREAALDVLAWREDDATRNSVSMLAQAHFSHRALQGVSKRDMIRMLDEKGIVWGESQTHFKRGVYLQRVTRERALTEDERARIPEKHRPDAGATFLRSSVEVLDMEPVRKTSGAIDRLMPQSPA